MVFDVYGCQVYILIVWLTVQCRAEEICQTEGNITVVPICSSVTVSSHTIVIDTSAVPASEETECNCSIEFGLARSIDVFYQPNIPENAPCGLQFWLGDTGFFCNDIIVALEDPFETITFSKTTKDSDEDTCLMIFIDRHHESRAVANLTCYGTSRETASSTVETTIAETSTSTAIRSNLPISVSSEESVDNSGSSTGSLPGTTTDRIGTESNNKHDDKESNTVIIGAAAGGGGAVLIIAAIVVVIYYLRKRRKNPNKDFTSKHSYVNTTSDHEVTDNVVYNMEFPDEKEHSHIPLHTVDSTYNTIDDDTQKQAAANTSTPAVYSNLRVDVDGGSYNMADLDANHKKKEIPVSVKFNNLQLNDEARAYNTVEFPDIQTNESLDQALQPDLDNNLAYDTLEHEPVTDKTNELNRSAAEQSQESNITYAVVNRTKANDVVNDIDKSNQFQVAESGDTYAVVNKKSAK